MSIRFTLLASLVIAALLSLAPGAAAKTIEVPDDAKKIQGAVNKAKAGDTIEIRVAKRYTENVVVDKPGLSIVGKPGVIIDGGDGGINPAAIEIAANRVKLSQLKVFHGDGIECNADDCQLKKVVIRTGDDDCFAGDGRRLRMRWVYARSCGGSNAIEFDGNRFKITDSVFRQSDNACVELGTSSNRANNGIFRRNRIVSCEDSQGLDIDGDGLLIKDNVIRGTDGDAIELDGNDNVLIGNNIANIENECMDVDGDRNRVIENKIEGCSDNGLDASGDRLKVKRNQFYASSTDDDCVDVDGRNAKIIGNNADLCDGGFDVSGENPYVVGNTATRAGDDSAFDIDCFNQSNGAPSGEACSNGLVKNNLGSGNNNDDEGFDISVTSGTGEGFKIVDNVSRRNNDGGFDLDVDDGIIKKNKSVIDGSEGNEASFEIDGDRNLVERNLAKGSVETGFELNGDRMRVRKNRANFNTIDGFKIASSSNRTVMFRNWALKNRADGIENDGTNTKLLRNVSSQNRADCTSDGSIAQRKRNKCADGSNFNEPGSLDD